MFVIIIQCVNLVLLMIQRFPDTLDKEDFVKGCMPCGHKIFLCALCHKSKFKRVELAKNPYVW